MTTVTSILAFEHLLDILALAAGIMLLCLLLLNRRRYGRFYLTAPSTDRKNDFAAEMSLQLMSQQSQKAYDKLQRTLMREFEPLCGIGDGRWAGRQNIEDKCFTMNGPAASAAQRRHRYRLAEEMLVQGAERQEILRRCGLAQNEFALLQGLHQMASKNPSIPT